MREHNICLPKFFFAASLLQPISSLLDYTPRSSQRVLNMKSSDHLKNHLSDDSHSDRDGGEESEEEEGKDSDEEAKEDIHLANINVQDKPSP